jgi:hypothetical protein
MKTPTDCSGNTFLRAPISADTVSKASKLWPTHSMPGHEKLLDGEHPPKHSMSIYSYSNKYGVATTD